jgi:carbonic anhydrase/acetyltransferase-like protein (isoleucine patch superfamily)
MAQSPAVQPSRVSHQADGTNDRQVHLAQLRRVELINGRAAMVGLVIGVVVEGLTGFGILHQIGLGALVKQGVVIGKGVIVGAGSVVLGPVADGKTVIGTPARELTKYQG